MHRTIHTVLPFAPVLLLSLVITSCTPRLVRRPIEQETEAEEQLPPSPDTLIVVAPVDTGSIDSIPSPTILLDSLMTEAMTACSLESFARADSLLRESLTMLSGDSGRPVPVEDVVSGEYYEAIADLYTETMPSRYLDSIPEMVAAMVFRKQFSISLDSLEVPHGDSAFLANLDCHEGMPYNVPITWNERVLKSLYVLTNQRKPTIERWLKRGTSYLPMMRAVFADSGLPSDLTYLPLIESGFNPRAYSHAHASGLWQFIASTGRNYGLRYNYWLDERRDPVAATRSAASYLKKLYDDFGDWYLALAAYNCGENGLARACRRADTSDYWQLRLPRETMNYVPQFIAALMIAKNPHCFGLEVEWQEPLSFDTVHIDACVDMNLIAEKLAVDSRQLKELNPHIRRWCTPPEMSDVVLYIPSGTREAFDTFYANLSDEDKVRWYRHKIRRGDNLIRIARHYKVSVEAIKSVNELRSSRIIAGRHLYVPIPVTASYPSGNEPRASRKSRSPTSGVAASVEAAPPPGRKAVYHEVRRGETLWGLASVFGVEVDEIRAWNSLSSGRSLKAGQTLVFYPEKAPAIEKPASSGSAGTSRPEPEATTREDAPQETERSTYVVSQGETLYGISRKLGVSMGELARWNNKDLTHPRLRIGERLQYQSPSPGNPPAPSPGKKATGRTIQYRIQPGDNLSRLAGLFSVSIDDLQEMNGLSGGSILHIGDTLLVPSAPSGSRKGRQDPARIVYYEVKKGDNLWTIARKFSIPLDRLLIANDLDRGAVLMPGDTIRVVLLEDK